MPDILDTLIGKQVTLFGVTDNRFKIGNAAGATLVLEAVEDPNDGYRSMLETVKLADESGCTFYQTPVITTTVRKAEGGNLTGWEFVDKLGRVWLAIGTDNADSYYPSFIFRWSPHEPRDMQQFAAGCATA